MRVIYDYPNCLSSVFPNCRLPRQVIHPNSAYMMTQLEMLYIDPDGEPVPMPGYPKARAIGRSFPAYWSKS